MAYHKYKHYITKSKTNLKPYKTILKLCNLGHDLPNRQWLARWEVTQRSPERTGHLHRQLCLKVLKQQTCNFSDICSGQAVPCIIIYIIKNRDSQSWKGP